VTIGLIVFACAFGSALLGVRLRAALPQHHLSADSKDVVKLATGLIATMAALVLGLLIASAKGSYDAQSSAITELATDVILLDRVLAHYGPDAREARDTLRRTVADAIERLWPVRGSRPPQLEPVAGGEEIYTRIQALLPVSDAQHLLKAQALKIIGDMGLTRWLLSARAGHSIPIPFLALLILWLAIIFVSFGLLAPSNGTALVTLLACTLSVSGAIVMILELDRPFGGMIQVSSGPLRYALAHLGQ
jgi:hypothetical protein